MQEQSYPIECTCGASVRPRAWALHILQGRKEVQHLTPAQVARLTLDEKAFYDSTGPLMTEFETLYGPQS